MEDRSPERVIRLVRRTAERHIGLFHHFPDIDIDDMTQTLLPYVWKALPAYKEGNSWQNFVMGVAHRKLLNAVRDRYRMARHDKLGARPADDIEVLDPIPPEPETFEGEICGGDGKPLLVDFLGMVYRHARRLTADASRQGMSYEPAQRVAVGAFARRYKMSVRETRGVFEDRPDLCRVLGFPPLPSRAWFGRALGAPLS